MQRAAKLFIVMPCYNEEAIIQLTIDEVSKKMDELIQLNLISTGSAMLFVDDGSKDETWRILMINSLVNDKVKCVKLAANVGHQSALMAGILSTRNLADVVITMDADLQHDINALNDFIQLYHKGFDIVFGVRNDRNTDTLFKKTSALFFYKMMSSLGVNVIKNHADFRLMGANVIEAISLHSEVHLFLRGILQTVGFKQTILYFNVKDRVYGSSKYSLSKMLKLALDGITSFSVKPLRLISLMGVIIFLVSIVMIMWNVSDYFRGKSIPGWASLSSSIWFLGGLIILSIGVVGEYIGKIYNEVKRRPRFIIEDQRL